MPEMSSGTIQPFERQIGKVKDLLMTLLEPLIIGCF
jgi:hypothetical protein